MHYKCEGKLDQGRYIGDDPVGYGCQTPASRTTHQGHLLCESCYRLYDTDHPRLTLLPPLGFAGQDRLFEQAFRQLGQLRVRLRGAP